MMERLVHFIDRWVAYSLTHPTRQLVACRFVLFVLGPFWAERYAVTRGM